MIKPQFISLIFFQRLEKILEIGNKFSCSCGSAYIGQTRRNLLSRIKEHDSSEKSEVCKHLLQNPTHCVDFITPQF